MSIPSCVSKAFEIICRKHPDLPAIFYQKEYITYSTLERVTRKTSQYFKPGQIIMVGIDEGKDLVALELAIWRSGATVCPFDIKRDPRAREVVSWVKPDLIVISLS